MSQAVQVVGALVILAAFAAAQARRLDVRSRTYLVLNVVGAGALALDAWRERQWGFLLLGPRAAGPVTSPARQRGQERVRTGG